MTSVLTPTSGTSFRNARFPVWRERYAEHPIVGVLARALVWTIADERGHERAVVLDGEGFVGADGRPVEIVETGASVRLWHPIGSSLDLVLAWRRYFEDRGLRQPFKQAHREVYLLTDAERATRTYSNRFAAHVLRQHQFHALCGARGWRNRLRMCVDDSYEPAQRALDRRSLRAEFWIEGVGDQHGIDTNESGAFLYLTTDQVRFYRSQARANRAHAGGGDYAQGARESAEELAAQEPLPLEEIPALVFSEVMRDVDLFVGVASVGANPEWQDGGPENRYREYWWSFGFGELSETGRGRRELLGRLVPKLAIAEACSFEGRFLVVRGKLHAYKIHLGSGNVLIVPSERYLCIVPGSGVAERALHLPFEGDRTTSIVLSKAFLLADDDSITDPSICSQIRR